MTYNRGEQWWDLAGSGAPSLTAQLPLLDGTEDKSDSTVNKDKIRALSPDSPGEDVRDSLGFHEETPDAPPMVSTYKRGGGSRSPALISIGADYFFLLLLCLFYTIYVGINNRCPTWGKS